MEGARSWTQRFPVSYAAKCNDAQFFLNFQLSSFGLLLAEVPGEKGEFIPGPFEAPDGVGHLLTIDEDDEAAGKFHKSCMYIYIHNTY